MAVNFCYVILHVSNLGQTTAEELVLIFSLIFFFFEQRIQDFAVASTSWLLTQNNVQRVKEFQSFGVSSTADDVILYFSIISYHVLYFWSVPFPHFYQTCLT